MNFKQNTCGAILTLLHPQYIWKFHQHLLFACYMHAKFVVLSLFGCKASLRAALRLVLRQFQCTQSSLHVHLLCALVHSGMAPAANLRANFMGSARKLWRVCAP